jgi:integrase/recombinase XerD
MKRRKAPAGCYWRGNVLWGQFQVKGRQFRFTLRTDDPAVAVKRWKAAKERAVSEAYFGEKTTAKAG